jgi:preprotein translocase subunit SecG
MFLFLLIVQTLVAATMVAVILMQRSEGGGLGVGGSPSGLMSARGAADFLTRATAILATMFVVLSIALAGLATIERAPVRIDPGAVPVRPAQKAPFQPGGGPATLPGTIPGQAPPVVDPIAGAARQVPSAPVGNGSGTAPPPAQ